MKCLNLLGAVLFLLLPACRTATSPGKLTDQAYWKNQALHDILPYWTKYARDTAHGAFFTNLDGQWKALDQSPKYPSMISRHLFSYSAAYLMSGQEEFIDLASRIKDYLLNHAWDKKYGGWFDTITHEGEPLQTSKSIFVQVYAITGLAMYYFVTRDPEVLDYIEKSNNLLETKAWDGESGGYFNVLNRDWSVQDENKSFSALLTPVSGYLLYLYLATRNGQYLVQAERISDTMINRMIHPESGWILESFDRNWTYLPGTPDETEINTGHNMEAAWMLARLYLLNGRQDYLDIAKKLSTRLHTYGFDGDNGIWYASIANLTPGRHSLFTYWWIQAYGNMLDLNLYRLYHQDAYLAYFKKGSAFWDSFFLDRAMGDTYFSVFSDGRVKESVKANPYKTSYHSMEHCLLNYLYLSFWVNRDPVALHFKIRSSVQGDLLYPSPVEDAGIEIIGVAVNHKNHKGISKEKQAVILPHLENTTVVVKLKSRQAKS